MTSTTKRGSAEGACKVRARHTLKLKPGWGCVKLIAATAQNAARTCRALVEGMAASSAVGV